jgi:hypothetical protein
MLKIYRFLQWVQNGNTPAFMPVFCYQAVLWHLCSLGCGTPGEHPWPGSPSCCPVSAGLTTAPRHCMVKLPGSSSQFQYRASESHLTALIPGFPVCYEETGTLPASQSWCKWGRSKETPSKVLVAEPGPQKELRDIYQECHSTFS